MRAAAVLGSAAMATSYAVANYLSLSIPEDTVRGCIATALVASGISMFR